MPYNGGHGGGAAPAPIHSMAGLGRGASCMVDTRSDDYVKKLEEENQKLLKEILKILKSKKSGRSPKRRD